MSLDGFIPCAVRRLSGMAVELYSGIVLPRLGLNLCEGKAACLADKQHGTLDRIACASITIVRPNGGNVNDHPLTDRISRRFLIHGYDTPFHFPRFARGDNTITMTGSGRYTFTCEWPVNVGG